MSRRRRDKKRDDRRRRDSFSNRRLPTSSSSYSPYRFNPVAQDYYGESLDVRPTVRTSSIRAEAPARRQQYPVSPFRTYSAFQHKLIKIEDPLLRIASSSRPGLKDGVFNKRDVCVQRAQRAEVMHATGKAGRGGQKTPVWTDRSSIKCKGRK